MKKLMFLFSIASFPGICQDTFSILAFDSITRQIGAAGASCVDLFQTGFTDHFITEILPDTGAIATQAQYIPANQGKARVRMRAGDTPAQIMSYLQGSDAFFNPHVRQYGAIRIGHPSAAHTGTQCTDYKGHIVGPNYTIHGNILLGREVLDSMEARFLRTEGDLACKLMGAMQGAKMVGADTRCAGNNSSSLFAFLKVCEPTNSFGSHSLLLSLRTHPGDSIEPIDSLQELFDFTYLCGGVVDAVDDLALSVPNVHPNPVSGEIILSGANGQAWAIEVKDVLGRVVHRGQFRHSSRLNVAGWDKGLYFFEFRDKDRKELRKVIIE